MLKGRRDLGECGFQINVLFNGFLLWCPGLYVGIGKLLFRLEDACICSCRLADTDGVVSIPVVALRQLSWLIMVARGAQGMQPPGEPAGEFCRAAEKAVVRGSAVGSRAGSRATQEDDISVGGRMSDCTAAANAALAAGQCAGSMYMGAGSLPPQLCCCTAMLNNEYESQASIQKCISYTKILIMSGKGQGRDPANSYWVSTLSGLWVPLVHVL